MTAFWLYIFFAENPHLFGLAVVLTAIVAGPK